MPFALVALALAIAMGLALVYTDQSLVEQLDKLRSVSVVGRDESSIESLSLDKLAMPPPRRIPSASEQDVELSVDVASGQVEREPLPDTQPDSIERSSFEVSQLSVDAQPAIKTSPSVDTLSSVDTPPSVDAAPSDDKLTSVDIPTSVDDTPPSDAPSPRDVFSVPVEKLSLRDQPDLFRQLVQLYNATLTENPDNSEATAALRKLQGKTYAELEAAISAKEMSITDRLLKDTGELFPEMKEELRYQALSALVAQQKREAIRVVAEKEVSQKKAPPKPAISSLSMTLGILENGRFVSRDDGTVVMIRIDYSNFDNSPASPGDDTLILRIRAAGNPLSMAEIPVAIHGDRGTKSFTVNTMIKGGGVEYYQLDFILQGRVLESRIVARTPISS